MSSCINRSLFAAILALVPVLESCARSAKPVPEGYGVFTDDTGLEMRIRENPWRIVSLVPSVTASVFRLGAGGRLKGATRWCRIPEGFEVEIVGDMLRPDMEKTAALRPDVVFASMEGSSAAHVAKMRAAGIQAYVFGECRSWPDIIGQFRMLGTILGLGREAGKMAEGFERRVQSVRDRLAGVSKPRLFLQISDDPVMTCAKGTYLDEMIGMAGASNIASSMEARYPRIDAETVILRDPEVIVATTMTGGGAIAPGRWKAFRDVSAARSGRIHVIDSDLVCHPTPFEFAEGLEALARLAHPEKFE